MGFLINLIVLAAIIFVGIKLYKKFKEKKTNAIAGYYAEKRLQYPWLDKWLNDWNGKGVDIVAIRAKDTFGKDPHCEPEQGLTLECPSCGCPHSWVLLHVEEIVENKETNYHLNGRGGEKTDSIYFTGRSIKDFKCLNCGHTQHNEYDEEWRWPRDRKDDKESEQYDYDPPKPAWEIPGNVSEQAGKKIYEQLQAQQSSAAAPQSAPSPQTVQASASGINPDLMKAAELGNRDAAYDIATMYLLGRGVAKSMEEADRWLSMKRDEYAYEYSEEGGCFSPEAYFAVDIAWCAFHASQKENYEDAVALYQISADMNCATALYDLGNYYESGAVVPMDKQKALSLFEKAAAKGYKDSKEVVKRLKKEMK